MLVEGSQPSQEEVPESLDELFPVNGFRFKSNTPAQRFAWTRGLTAMRKQMTEEVQGRIIIGGKTKGFSGLYAGIFEEAWMSLLHGQPLYIAAAFGGVGYALRRALENDGQLLQESNNTVTDREKIYEIARNRGLEIIGARDDVQPDSDFSKILVTGDKMLHDFIQAGQTGLAAALNNGLTEEENLELLRCTQAPRIADLILRGLRRIEK